MEHETLAERRGREGKPLAWRKETVDGEEAKGEARAHVLAERRLLQTGRTGPRGQFIANKWVTLVRRRISPEFIVYYSAVPRNDIGPCLLVVALMSLIAPPVRNRTAASHRRTSREPANPETSSSFPSSLPPVRSPSSFALKRQRTGT